MKKYCLDNVPILIVTSNASGAVQGAMLGHVVIIVDVINMSTSLVVASEAGALAVFGASPDFTRAPVTLDPYKVGKHVGKEARINNKKIIVITEPRVGTEEERRNNATKVLKGIEVEGGVIEEIIPNLGLETAKIVDFKDRIVLGVSDTGGVAYEAAFHFQVPIIFGTIARTLKFKGEEPARSVAKKAIQMAKEKRTGITVVAASSNSLEDVLAAEYIAKCISTMGFLQ